ncbi:MAG: ABC transporter permease subunit, partial [Bacteroidota bacterium]
VFQHTGIGYATLEGMFSFAPTILMFLIPAITMRSFAEETQTGTIELLVTRPITDMAIILGKFLASLTLVLFAILPTMLYVFSINRLGDPIGNLDMGQIFGSYVGLIFLSGTFVSIGIFASSITDNQIVAFVLGVFLCFFSFMAFDFLSNLPAFLGGLDSIVEMLGINYHYNLISRGAIDSRDVIYFISVITVFLMTTKVSLEKRKW